MKGTFLIFGSVILVVVGVSGAPHLFHWPFWKFPAITAGILLIGLALLSVRAQIRFRRKGYAVLASNVPASFQYRERHEGRTRSLKLPGDLIENGHPVYTRLTQEEWQASVPDWASQRRLEIEGRILEDPFNRPW